VTRRANSREAIRHRRSLRYLNVPILYEVKKVGHQQSQADATDVKLIGLEPVRHRLPVLQETMRIAARLDCGEETTELFLAKTPRYQRSTSDSTTA
jgi:hypothetical protein